MKTYFFVRVKLNGKWFESAPLETLAEAEEMMNVCIQFATHFLQRHENLVHANIAVRSLRRDETRY